MSYGDQTYAGKTLHKILLAGYPEMSTGVLVADIESVSARFSSHEHPHVEKFFIVAQPSPDSPPIFLTELLPYNLNTYTEIMTGKFPVHWQLELCCGIARGVQFLHDNEMIHNNLHGGNVLITQNGQAKIGDFICPQIAELNKRSSPQYMAYMSAEALRNTNICSKASDIYSLGVIFLQVATQCAPKPRHGDEFTEVQRYKPQLNDIAGNPLLPLIIQCLNILPLRPSIGQLCTRISTAKHSPQNVISGAIHHVKVGLPCVGLCVNEYELHPLSLLLNVDINFRGRS